MFGGLLGSGVGAAQQQALNGTRAQVQEASRAQQGYISQEAARYRQQSIPPYPYLDLMGRPQEDLREHIDADIMEQSIALADVWSPKTVAPSAPMINWYGLSREDEIRRRFKNLVKMISRRANRSSDLPDVNAPIVFPSLEPVVNIPVPRTNIKDQWTMDQIVAYG